MKRIVCEGCGSNEFLEENGYFVCKYCGRKYLKTKDDIPEKESDFDLSEDVQSLLKKWDNDPENALKYANLILQIDPNNKRAIECRNNNSKGGCYIATAVYGSYDCPQVWTLRRYRDFDLAEVWYGKVFIRVYYAVSPILVKMFGNKKCFKKIWRKKLDKIVHDLQSRGVSNTPYNDRFW